MGKDSRAAEAMRQNRMETTIELLNQHMGKALGFHEHETCPKCGELEHNIERQWCPGYSHLLPDAERQPCRVVGDHLHAVCSACKFEWREWCKDHVPSPEDDQQLETSRLVTP